MKIVLIGGGGHASDVLGALEATFASIENRGAFCAGLVADTEIDMRRFEGRGVRQIGSIDDLTHLDVSHFIAAVGYPQGRRSVAERALAFGLKPYSVAHTTALLPFGTNFGLGSVVLARACVSHGVTIGAHVMIGAGAIIGHDCRIGDYTSVMPGAAVSGDTVLCEGCMVGANATVIEKHRVGAWARVGAGAVVDRDIPPSVTAVGVPARWPTSAG